MYRFLLSFGRMVPVLFLLPALSQAASSCEDLTALAITNTTITTVVNVPAGPFSAQPGRAGGRAPAPRDFPAFCRVTAVARPVPGSEITVEIWLPPAESWNGKFLGTGNGGYSGAIGYAAMESALRQGYATAGSDTGHAGEDLKFGLNHPEKIDDWAWRATHVMTETAKLVARSYYQRFPAYSYFSGCSTGGQQALMEAQRFPGDYDGIIAGAPGNNRVRLNMGFLWSWLALRPDQPGSLPPSKLPVLNRAAIAACDAQDGLADGLIFDPAHCAFDPAALQCKDADAADCLTAPQVEAVRKIYTGARNPRTGEQLYSGWARGTEAAGGNQIGGWAAYFVGRPEPARVDFWKYWVFGDPNWDPRSFDFDRDAAFADARLAHINANDADLSAFRKRGGKLLMYSGWADPVVPPGDVIRYFDDVQMTMGGPAQTSGFLRLFMAPGMGHCGGGPGPNTFDSLAALDRWVTQGSAPDRIVVSQSTGGKVTRTRPLCPYPQVARWNGTGSPDDAAQFTCADPSR